MKNILIMGIGRAGKTTLSHLIKDKWNSYSLLHSDSLKWAIIRARDKEDYFIKNVDIQKKYEHSEFFQKTILEFYNSLIREDKEGYGYILESGQLHPKIVKEMIDFNKTYVICLGLGNLKAEDIVEQCLKYDTEDSWTYGLARDYLLEHAQDWYNCNEMLKQECPKCNIKYIDTSKDRFDIFEKIINEIEMLNKSNI